MREARKFFDHTQDPTLNVRATAVRRKQTVAKIAEAMVRLNSCIFQQDANDRAISLGAGSLNARLFLKRTERSIRAEIDALEAN